MLQLKELNRMSLRLTVMLAAQSKKSLRRWLGEHQPTRNKARTRTDKVMKRFYKKSKYKKILFMLKNK